MSRVIILALLLALPVAVAQAPPPDAFDAIVTIVGDGAPVQTGGVGLLVYENATDGEWMQWRLNASDEYTTFEFRIKGVFDVVRAQQVVPFLFIDADDPGCVAIDFGGLCHYPLFDPFPNARIWEVDGSARVYYREGDAGDFILRLGVAGPVRGTLALQRDVVAPTFEFGSVQNLTHFSFYRESLTNELALGDMQVRKVGSEEWVVNPTQVFHFRQRFPVQGLDSNATYETRTVFVDWAGNEVISPVETVTTLAKPVVPIPVVTPASPDVNATLPSGAPVTVSVRFESPESPVSPSDVLVFFDKKPVLDGFVVKDGMVSYTPPTLADGVHSVSFEVTNEAGGTGVAKWNFVVGSADASSSKATPALGFVGFAVAVAVALLFARR